MAVSIYDEQFLNDEQRAQLEALGREWQRAKAAGDQAGMDSAKAAGERIRSSAGYYGGEDGTQYVPLAEHNDPAQRETYTPAQLPSYQPQTDAVNRVFDAERESTLAALKSAYDANRAELERERAGIPAAYQAERNSTAAASELAARNFNEYAAASGLSSGGAGQAALARSNQLQGDLSALSRQELAEQREIESRVAQLKLQYQNDISQAIAQGEYDRAMALYQEYQRAADSAVTTAQAQADENYRSWQSGVSARETGRDNEYEDWQRRLQEAQLKAQYGDLSGVQGLGVDTSGYEAELAAARQAAASGSAGTAAASNIPPLGTEDWMDYIISASGASGQDYGDYIRSHRSELGLTASDVAEYAQKVEAYYKAHNDFDVENDELKMNTPAGTLYGLIMNTPLDYDNIIDRIEAGVKSGQISELAGNILLALVESGQSKGYSVRK